MIPVNAALTQVLEHAKTLEGVCVDLHCALGRVLREDIRSDSDLPRFDRAAMDGYAVRASELATVPVVLPVSSELRAGQFPTQPLPLGTVIQIMTGAPVPEGADAVIPIEKTKRVAPGRIEFSQSPGSGAHIARRGSEVRAGQAVLRSGLVLSPAHIAVLASVGNSSVRVGPRPRVAILVTGDELVDVDTTPQGGQIRNANGPAIEQQVRRAGGEPIPLGVATDNPEALARALAPGFEADVLIVSGGVSAGEYDFVEAVLAEFGVEVFFEAVAIKPGKPLVFGRRGSTLIFGLPGNPVSAQVVFEVFVRPTLMKMQGATGVSRPLLEVEVQEGLRNNSGRQAYLPARVWFEDGRAMAEPIPSRGSADVVAHARANALLVLPADLEEGSAGCRLSALALDGFPEWRP